jgi:hypothetical protein
MRPKRRTLASLAAGALSIAAISACEPENHELSGNFEQRQGALSGADAFGDATASYADAGAYFGDAAYGASDGEAFAQLPKAPPTDPFPLPPLPPIELPDIRPPKHMGVPECKPEQIPFPELPPAPSNPAPKPPMPVEPPPDMPMPPPPPQGNPLDAFCLIKNFGQNPPIEIYADEAVTEECTEGKQQCPNAGLSYDEGACKIVEKKCKRVEKFNVLFGDCNKEGGGCKDKAEESASTIESCAMCQAYDLLKDEWVLYCVVDKYGSTTASGECPPEEKVEGVDGYRFIASYCPRNEKMEPMGSCHGHKMDKTNQCQDIVKKERLPRGECVSRQELLNAGFKNLPAKGEGFPNTKRDPRDLTLPNIELPDFPDLPPIPPSGP